MNYIFLFLLVCLFVLEGHSEDHVRILIALLLSWIASTLALFMDWLTLDGREAAIVVGLVVLGLGGWILALLLLYFFITSSLLTKLPTAQSEENRPWSSFDVRRDSSQVWANGFWIALFSIGWFLFEETAILVGAATAIAVIAADTWATELGTRSVGATFRLTDLRRVKPGSDGGVSLIGTLSALAGSASVATLFLLLTHIHSPTLFWIILTGGFLGCILDSVIGAMIESSGRHRSAGWIQSGLANRHPEMAESNNMINWISSGAGAFVAFLFTQMINYGLV